MSEATDLVELLAWDTEWLGLSVARLKVAPYYSAAATTAAIEHCRATGVRLLYLSLSPTNTAGAAAAVRAGAWLADVKLTFELSLFPAALAATHSLPPPNTVLTKTTAPTLALEQLVLQSGAYSRFRRDARIWPLAFAALYKQWLYQCLNHGTVWVASTKNKPVGLLAFAARDSYASIELMAVAPAAQGQGIGQELVRAAEREAQQSGFPKLQVVTQGANQPAQDLYRRCGFQLAHAAQVYHLWL